METIKYILGRLGNIWVIGDYHFYHTNVISYCNRPFINAIEMNEYIINENNHYITDNDILIILGDYGFGGTEKFQDCYNRLNGNKYLILGNHDYRHKNKLKRIFNGKILPNVMVIDINGMPVYLSHQPLLYPFIGLNIHGHIHEKIVYSPQHINVSVERTNYAPMQLISVVNDWKMNFLKNNLYSN